MRLQTEIEMGFRSRRRAVRISQRRLVEWEGGDKAALIQLHRSEWSPTTPQQLHHGGLRVTCCPVAPPTLLRWLGPNRGEQWGWEGEGQTPANCKHRVHCAFLIYVGPLSVLSVCLDGVSDVQSEQGGRGRLARHIKAGDKCEDELRFPAWRLQPFSVSGYHRRNWLDVSSSEGCSGPPWGGQKALFLFVQVAGTRTQSFQDFSNFTGNSSFRTPDRSS